MLLVPLYFAVLGPPASLVQHVREALSIRGAKAVEEALISGSADYYGVRHEYSLQFKTDGKFVQRYRGPLGEAFGSDGTTLWKVDHSGAPQKLDFEDRDEVYAMSLVLTSGWLNPKAPVILSETPDTIHIKLKGSGQEETLRIDPKTWLPVEATFPNTSGNLDLKLSNWQAVGDRRVPLSVDVTDGGLTDKITAEKVSPTAGGFYEIPSWQPADISFDSAIKSTIEAKKAISGHMLVHPLVGGKDVGWFILDSGADVMVIDKGVADDLKLAKVGRLPLTGVGGTVEAAFRPVPEFTLGPATLKNITFTEFDLGQIGKFLGVKLAGIVGSDMFRRSIIQVDFKTAAVDIFPRDGYKLGSGSWMPVRFNSGNPAVEAVAEGSPRAWYRFDTGANGAVTFHSPFAKRWKLMDGKETRPAGLGGVGGITIARSGQIGWFELGGHRFEKPTVTFSAAEKGAFSEPYLAGNIGQDFMTPFRIVFDFSGYRIALIARS